MRIVCLINGGDGLVAYHLMKNQHPKDEVIPVHFDLGLPFSNALKNRLPEYVDVSNMTHYAKIVKLHYEDNILNSNRPLEPILWHALIKYRADKLVTGILATDAKNEHNLLEFANKFNDRVGNKVLEYPLVEMNVGKREVMQLAIRFKCLTPVLYAWTCRSSEIRPYGCGNCTQCIRKRTAIKRMDKMTDIPLPDKIVGYARECIYDLANLQLSGVENPVVSARYLEMEPTLIEFLKTDDIQKMAKKARRWVPKRPV